MQVSVEEVGQLGRKMTIVVPADKIEAEVTQRLNTMKGQAKIDGFRPGKVPMNVVKQRYEGSIRQEVLADQMQANYRDAVLQEKLRPAGAPTIQPEQIEPGQDLTFIANFDVYPEITVSDFTKLEVTVPVSEVEEQHIEYTLTNMREQHKDYAEEAVAAENGHRVTMDFVGKLDGVEFEGGKSEDYRLTLGGGGMIAGFEDNIVGMKAGEDKTFMITFPEDYGNEQLAGQEASFDIALKLVESGKLPEVDSDFVKGYGIESGEESELRAKIKESLENELKTQIGNKSKAAVMECVIANHDFELPESLIAQEVEALRKQAAENFQMQQSADLPDELFVDEAKRRIKLGLVIGEIVNEQKLQVNPVEVEQRIEQIARQYQDYQQVIEYYTNNTQARASIEAVVMEDQVVSWVLSHVKTVEQKEEFDELVKPNQQQQ